MASIKTEDVLSKMPLAYNPSNIEHKWYKWWKEKNFFRCSSDKKFTMLLPPPNITGTLHLGHALTCSLEDVLGRWYQMQKYNVTWIPGCDHAGIATQAAVERHLWASKQIRRQEIGHNDFIDEVWKWQAEKSTIIENQIQKVGAALNWEKKYFTLDEKQTFAVNEAFIQLFDSSLIYQANTLVNWSCKLSSAISDIEVEHLQLDGPTDLHLPSYAVPITFGRLFHFAYKVNGTGEELVVSTTRPETMLGDTALMVHPDDSRYSYYIGKLVTNPFTNNKIPIIADTNANPNFGTGVVKITPAHDFVDFELSKKHNLAIINVLDDHGNIISDSFFNGLPRFIARELILNELAKLALYKGWEPHSMLLPRCSRTNDVIEPLLKMQWFVNCEKMAQNALKAVDDGELNIYPTYQVNVWREWLSKCKDWCISRQLWWGHCIPAYEVTYDGKFIGWVAASSEFQARNKASLKFGIQPSELVLKQESDVLDTWFSSAIVPFSVCGWPNKGKEFNETFPLSIMETGHDILFFWVARMVMLSLQLTGLLPFKEILLHGLICDSEGHKMSKSKGNVIDPIDVIDGISLKCLTEKIENSGKAGTLTQSEVQLAVEMKKKTFPNGIPQCGADALRFALCSSNIKNQQITFDILKVEKSKFFGNKIWQTVRFLLMTVQKLNKGESELHSWPYNERGKMCSMDRWILSLLANLVINTDRNFASYDFHHITDDIRSFWIFKLCDVYLESVKPVLNSSTCDSAEGAFSTLFTCIYTGIHLLAPFMPYLCEELYHYLPLLEKQESISASQYPKPEQFYMWKDVDLENHVEKMLQVVSGIRSLKKSYNIASKNVAVNVVSNDSAFVKWLTGEISVVKTLSRIESLVLNPSEEYLLDSPMSSITVSNNTSVYLHLEGLVDLNKETLRLRNKIAKISKEIEKLSKKISHKRFDKSPNWIKEATFSEKNKYEEELQRVEILLCDIEKWST